MPDNLTALYPNVNETVFGLRNHHFRNSAIISRIVVNDPSKSRRVIKFSDAKAAAKEHVAPKGESAQVIKLSNWINKTNASSDRHSEKVAYCASAKPRGFWL